MSALSGDPLVRIRPATAADLAELLHWRNDPSVFRWARQAEPVTRSDHESWLCGVLADPNRWLLIGEVGSKQVGMVRLDRVFDREGTAEVSITVAPHSRGLGVGRELLAAAARHWLNAGGRVIVATVHRDNENSLRLFASAGYLPVEGCTGDWTTWELTLLPGEVEA